MRISKSLYLPLLIVCSCVQQPQTSRSTIRYVKDILGDRESYEYSILSAAQNVNSTGDIYVIGTEDACNYFKAAFMECDRHDNVDGTLVPDDLPDFAGETVAMVIDSVGLEWKMYLDESEEETMRRNTVGLALASLGDKAFLSRYDSDGLGEKKPAKFILLAGSQYDAYGKFDVDTLFEASGCKVPAFTPLEIMLDGIFDNEKAQANIGIFGNESEIATGVYASAFKERLSADKGQLASQCTVYDCSADEYPLCAFLDRYIAEGNIMPLDQILVDDIRIDRAALTEDYERISSVMNEEYMTYGKLFGERFRIVFADDAVTERCYAIFRRDNSFTHYISEPDSQRFIARSSLSDSESLMLVRSEPEFKFINVQD